MIRRTGRGRFNRRRRVIKSPRALGPHIARSSRGEQKGRLVGHQPARERIINGSALGHHSAGMSRRVISIFTFTSLPMSTNTPIDMPIGALPITGHPLPITAHPGMIAAGDHGQCEGNATPAEKSLPRSYCRFAILHLSCHVTVSRRGEKQEGATTHRLNNTHRVSRGASDDALVPVAAASCGEAPSAPAVKIDFRGFVEAT